MRKDTEVPQPSGPTDNVANETVYEEMDDSLERAATTATSLDAEQDRGNINKTQSKATLNEPSSLKTSSGIGSRRQETMRDTIAQTGFENVSKTSNDSLLIGVSTPRSDEDSLKLKELMELCTNLQNRVIDREKTKTSQAQEIICLKRRVKRLETKNRSKTRGLKRLYKVGLSARIESSEDEGLGEEDASKQGRIDDIDANEDIYLVNVHRDEDMFGVNNLEGDKVIVETKVDHEVVVETKVASKDVNLSIDEVTLAQALAALKGAKPKADKVMLQEPKQGTITTTTAATTVTATSIRPKAKGIVKVQDKAEFDEDERLAREKYEANVALTEEWNDIQAKIDADYQLAQRFKEENILQQKEQKRRGKDHQQELNKVVFNKAMKRRAGDDLEQESSKKKKLEEDKESEGLKQCLEIIPDNGDDVTIDATPLSTKSPTIMLKNFDREDLEVLNLKTMFEHHVKDNVWNNQQGLVKVLNWKLYDSCGVHCVTMQSMLFYILVEKMYPLTKHTLHQMFNDVKLHVDYEYEMAFELLRFVKK
ncbi:hypothetical protein Tco_0227607 [Tanacetum coccineum]